MSSNVVPFPSCGLPDIWEKVVRRYGIIREITDKRHITRARPAATPLPIRPHLTNCPDGGCAGLKGQPILDAPFAKRMDRSIHKAACKPLPYSLTSESKDFTGSTVSADILHFRPMQATNRIRELRTARDMSQQALGDAIGCSKMTISDLERGNQELTLEYMRRIARVMKVKPADLMLDEDNPDRLTDQERMLIDDYRNSSDEKRELIMRVAEPPAERRNVA